MTTLPRRFAPNTSSTPPHAGRIGLHIFMAVVTAPLLLLILVYAMWIREPDWMPAPYPVLLWWDTGALVLASAVMELARRARAHLTIWLLAGDTLAVSFVPDQQATWQQLLAIGQGVTVNSSNNFLYVFTGLHAARIIGGLVIWAVTVARVCKHIDRTRRTTDLCVTY